MSDLKEKVNELTDRLNGILHSVDPNKITLSLKKLEASTTNTDFWKDQNKARTIMQEIGDLRRELEEIENLKKNINSISELMEDESLTDELIREIAKVQKSINEFEFRIFLSGDYDSKNAIVSIHAGQGGTEAMDWANMLFRMYYRFCERRGWKTNILDSTEGEEAGIKSITFKVSAKYSYGYLKGEVGAHRLVRQSPFNADNLRQTSFALVEVLPELAEYDIADILIKEEDLEWQFFRSSSQGGQNVQKVSTAVRLIHNPTGIAVTAQSERFQEQNRKNALSLLRGKLWLRQKEVEAATKSGIKGEYKPASWGNQIRSYVLHPYKMVKDLRTQIESANPESVLDGNLNEFIEAELKFSNQK